MDLINENHLAVKESELIFGIDKKQTFLSSHINAAAIESHRVFGHCLVVFFADKTTGYDFLGGDVLVVPLGGLCRRGNDRLGESLVLDHPVGKLHTADLALSGGILAPGAAGKIASDYHLYGESFGTLSHGHHRIGSGQLPVGHYIAGCVEEESGNLVKYLTFIWNTFGQNDIKGRDAVCSHHDESGVVDCVNIAHFAMIDSRLRREMKVGFQQSCHS